MRGLFGLIGLLVVLVIVGLVARKQLQATGHAGSSSASASASAASEAGVLLPDVSTPQKAQQLQRHIEDEVNKGVQQQNEQLKQMEEAMGEGKP